MGLLGEISASKVELHPFFLPGCNAECVTRSSNHRLLLERLTLCREDALFLCVLTSICGVRTAWTFWQRLEILLSANTLLLYLVDFPGICTLPEYLSFWRFFTFTTYIWTQIAVLTTSDIEKTCCLPCKLQILLKVIHFLCIILVVVGWSEAIWTTLLCS